MIRINLVPADFLSKQKQQHRVLQVGVAAVIFLMIISGISFMHMSKAAKVETYLEKREKRYQELKTIISKVNKLKADKKAVTAHLNAIKGLAEIRLLYTHFMQDLVKSMPGGVRFTSLRTTIKDAKTLSFNIPGMSRSAEDLAEWIRTLNNSTNMYKNVELGGIAITKSDTGKKFTFPITATYTVPK